MLKSAAASLALVLSLLMQSFAGTTVTPTTTLAAESGNNTSAANSFATSKNGNAGASNVSKENIHKLLYAGATTKVYAHFMAWWGSSSHINIGYSSANLTQVHNQISDMMSRGIDGMIIDWYGPGNTGNNQTSLYVKQDAETRGGKFEFAIMEDQGAIRSCAYASGCDATQALINDLNYIVNTYTVSPAYMHINGQPVIYTFDVENLPNIDWTKVMSTVQGNPKIVLRNNQGFQKSYTSGSYSWVAINTANQSDWAQGYLDNFYATSKSYPKLLTYAGVWKGFNDTAAAWTANRIMSQNCGQVWLATFNEMNKYFSTTTQVPGVQLVTWNDYEEGTEIESGIDNCVSVSGSVSGSDLYWTVSGQENTIDHYTVFISMDGQNLMPLANVAAGTHQLSLASFGLAQANYTLFVKAVGKPSMLNKMSAAIPLSLGNLSPVAALSITPSSGTAPVTVSASTAGSKDPDGTIVKTSIDFGDGTVLTAATASHTYATTGTYTVKATVTDNSGATGTATATVTVKANQGPVAAISVSPATGAAPMTVTASTANSKDPGGTITSSTIEFGDGAVANGPTATHVYNSAGTFTVKGTVKDNSGLTATSSATVTVTSAAQFVVNASSPANGSTISGPVHFVATTTSGSPVTAIRIYVDNASAFLVNATSVDTTLALTPGAHYVVLQAWNQQGQIAKTPLNISVVNQPPTANLTVTPSTALVPAVVTATVSGTDADGKVSAMSVDYGDGTVVNGAASSHTYNAPGTYTVTAKVTDNSGASAIAKSTVTAVPMGVAIQRPARGALFKGPVAITALAGAVNPIVAMRVYVDNIASYSLNSFSSSIGVLDTALTMPVGTHNVVVQAWDAKGAVYKASTSVTVQ